MASAQNSPNASINVPENDRDIAVSLNQTIRNAMEQMDKKFGEKFEMLAAKISRSLQPAQRAISVGRSASTSRSRAASIAPRQTNTMEAPAPEQRKQIFANLPEQLLLRRTKDLSFAAALTNRTATPLQNRYTILAPDEGGEDIIDAIQRSDITRECGPLKAVNRISPKCVVMTAETAQGAECAKQKIKATYGDKVEIKEAECTSRFLAKITGLDVTDQSATDIIADIRASNTYLANVEIGLVREYPITSGRRKYRNLIVTLPPANFAEIINYGRVLLGAQLHNIYEYCDILQCRKCWAFGHTHHGCTRTKVPLCRRCGMTHEEENCPLVSCIVSTVPLTTTQMELI